MGAKVKAYDPIIAEENLEITLARSPEELATDCDALVLVTDWQEFIELDYAPLAYKMRHPIIIDGRNCLNRQNLESAGFTYIGIGRSAQTIRQLVTA